MSIVIQQAVKGTGSAGVITLPAFGVAPANGDAVIAGFVSHANAITTVSLTGATFTEGPNTANGTATYGSIWFAPNVNSAGTVVSASSAGGTIVGWAQDVAGLATISVLDKSNSSASSYTTGSTGTLSDLNEYVFAIAGDATGSAVQPTTPGAPWNDRTGQTAGTGASTVKGDAIDQVVSATTALNPTFGGASPVHPISLIATFKSGSFGATAKWTPAAAQGAAPGWAAMPVSSAVWTSSDAQGAVPIWHVQDITNVVWTPASAQGAVPVWPVPSPLSWVLQVALDNNPFDAIADMVWTTVTTEVVSFTVEYGRDQATTQVGAAKLNVVFNDCDGDLTPTNSASPYYGNGQTTGLVPGKPVRLLANLNLVDHPMYYGYTKKWGPVPEDPMYQTAKLEAACVLDKLGNAYIANNLLYPGLVLALAPLVYCRLGDWTLLTPISANTALLDSSGSGSGHGEVYVPSGAATATTPFAQGGQSPGVELYDLNTVVILGDAGNIQSTITSDQSQVTQDQSQLASDQAQLAADQATYTTDWAAAGTAAAQANTDAGTIKTFATTVASNAATLYSQSQTCQNGANGTGIASLENDATGLGWAASGADIIAGDMKAQLTSAKTVAGTFASQTNPTDLIAAITSYLTYISTALSDAQALSNYAYTAQNSATNLQSDQQYQDPAASSLFTAAIAFALADAQTLVTNLNTTSTGINNAQTSAQNALSAAQTALSDAGQVTQDQQYVAGDEATLATDQAALANAVADSSGYVTMWSTAASPHDGTVFFQTTVLPVSGVFKQTIATVSRPTGGPTGSIYMNSSGLLVFALGNTAYITQPSSFTNAAATTTAALNDGAWHLVAWDITGTTITLWLDGIEMGTYTNSSIYPGIQQASGNPVVGIAGAISSGTTLQSDFVGNVGDCALFSAGTLDTAIVANLYVTATKMQHVHGTMDRALDVMIAALGQSAFDNLPLNFPAGTGALDGTFLCFAETAQTVQTQALQYIGDVAATEIGAFFQAPDGTVTFYPLAYPQGSVSLATIGDNEDTPYHYLGKGYDVPVDDTDVYPIVQFLPSTGTQSIADSGTPTAVSSVPPMVQVQNNAAVEAYGPNTLQLSSVLYASLSSATWAANLALLRYQYVLPRVTVKLTNLNVANLDIQLVRFLWDRMTFERQGPGEALFSMDGVIEQIKHSWDAESKTLETDYSLSPYELIFLDNPPETPGVILMVGEVAG